MQPVAVVFNNSINVMTCDPLVPNVSEIVVEVEEIRKLDVCSFTAKFANHGLYINGYMSL